MKKPLQETESRMVPVFPTLIARLGSPPRIPVRLVSLTKGQNYFNSTLSRPLLPLLYCTCLRLAQNLGISLVEQISRGVCLCRGAGLNSCDHPKFLT